MGEGLNVVQQACEAFGREDIPTILGLVADEVDWKFVGPLPHCSLRRSPAEVADFFAALGSVEALSVFEPREFIEAGENVTVLGYLEGYAFDTNQKFQSEWAHVVTVRNGKITRWRGFYNTAARYGH